MMTSVSLQETVSQEMRRLRLCSPRIVGYPQSTLRPKQDSPLRWRMEMGTATYKYIAPIAVAVAWVCDVNTVGGSLREVAPRHGPF